MREILKIHSERLRYADWNLTLPLKDAKRNDEIVTLASNQVLRWIDELNGMDDSDERVANLKQELRDLRKEENSIAKRHRVRSIFSELDGLQYKPDYIELIIDKNKDYERACKGFTINGIGYERLLGTNGGIKNHTIVFISKRLAPEIKRRIDNGRDPNIKLVPAKFEAYRALTCSASTPVSMPRGILVVTDCMTEFDDEVIYLTDENSDEPEITYHPSEHIFNNASDGCGLMTPELAERWSRELGLSYTACCFNTRLSWEKGIVFEFDIRAFADEIAGEYIVKDAWGNDVDIRDIEIVLTTSMLKLWDSYKSLDDYLENCKRNHYSFAITKEAPEKLESERRANYQYLQVFDFTKDDIEELIAPTIQEFKDVLGGDWRKTVLFLRGKGLDEEHTPTSDNDLAKALMADPRLIDDPYVQKSVRSMIRKRIDEAKTGAVKAHGNYSIVGGDLFALCQHIFGLEVTGLLAAGEVYNGFWTDEPPDELLCFRSPMSCAENVRRVKNVKRREVRRWFKYAKACTILNAWDTIPMACNGMD